MKWSKRTAQGVNPGLRRQGARPESTSNPARRVQFGLGAVLPHSNTPSLRVARFEDEDSLSDVAFRARGLAVLSASEVGSTKRLVRAPGGVVLFQDAALIVTMATIGSTITRTGDLFVATKHDVTKEAPFGRPFRAGLVLGYSQG
jgi:hypothetical protein